MNTRNPWLAVAAFSGLIAVIAGAYGAHGLNGAENQVRSFNTGVQYQMWHSLALIGVAWLSESRKGTAQAKWADAAGWLFTGGIVLFSGTLYYFGITSGLPISGSAPVGGIALMGGWAVLALAALRKS